MSTDRENGTCVRLQLDEFKVALRSILQTAAVDEPNVWEWFTPLDAGQPDTMFDHVAQQVFSVVNRSCVAGGQAGEG